MRTYVLLMSSDSEGRWFESSRAYVEIPRNLARFRGIVFLEDAGNVYEVHGGRTYQPLSATQKIRYFTLCLPELWSSRHRRRAEKLADLAIPRQL